VTRETLDETLDRVAREITAVPPDTTFGARLRPRLDEPVRQVFGPRTLVAATCVLALAVAAGLVRHNDPATPRVSVTQSAIAGQAAPSAQIARFAGDRADQHAGAAATTARATVALPRVEIEHTAAESAIPALLGPSVLDVAHLQLDRLVVEPVEVSSLEIPEISVTDLGAPEGPKE
jgi:hypothetical protein